jgi:hypothetical protein
MYHCSLFKKRSVSFIRFRLLYSKKRLLANGCGESLDGIKIKHYVCGMYNTLFQFGLKAPCQNLDRQFSILYS